MYINFEYTQTIEIEETLRTTPPQFQKKDALFFTL